MNRSHHLSAVFAELATSPPSSGASHPDIEVLTAYHDGLLSDTEARELLDHAQGCRDCTALLLDLGRLDEAALEEADEVLPEEIDRGWAALRTKLAATPASTSTVVPFPGSKPARVSLRTPPWYHALAAGLLLAVVGQTIRLQGLKQEIESLTEPQINTPYVMLSDARTRGSESTTQPGAVPGSAETALLFITPNVLLGPQTEVYESFRAEIVGGNRRWSKSGLEMGEQREFRISIRKQYFPSAEVQITLFGLSSGQEDMLAQFQLRLDSN